MLYQNRPCLLVNHVQAHGGAAIRNKSEDVNNLLDPPASGMKQLLDNLYHQRMGGQQTSTCQSSGRKEKKKGGKRTGLLF
jgi:hypothetical protein